MCWYIFSVNPLSVNFMTNVFMRSLFGICLNLIFFIIFKLSSSMFSRIKFGSIWNNSISGCSQNPPQTSKVQSFATVINGFEPLTVAAKLSTLDVCGGPIIIIINLFNVDIKDN